MTGKVQEAYSTLGAVDSQKYSTVKEAVLKVYELVPKAYRQRFRSWRKSDKQSHVEFATKINTSTGGVLHWMLLHSNLFDLMVLEQFKDCIPPEVATHIVEHGLGTASEAATLWSFI